MKNLSLKGVIRPPRTCERCGKSGAFNSMGSHVKWCGVDKAPLFWARVDKSGGQDTCWPWTGATDTWGYGTLGWNGGQQRQAHRVAYELSKGEIPGGRVLICHTCDNPPCCNPAHLFVGTDRDNMLDKVAKERHARGEMNKCNTLIARQVLEIRTLYSRDGQRSNADYLAKRYGVTRCTINNVISRRTWKHLP